MDKAGGMASTPKSTASTPAPGSERVKTLRCMRSLPPGLPPLEWRDEIRASCGCTHGDPLHAGARLNRGAVADARVQALAVVEDFDVVEHRRLGLLAGVEADLVDVLRLEGGEEALHGRIMEAVAAAAHGLGDAVPLQHHAVGLGGVLGGFKWSSQHPLKGSCDAGSKAAVGSVGAGAPILTWSPAGYRTR